MSISPTVGDGFYVTHMRAGIRMSCRCRSFEQAQETLCSMKDDVIVDLPSVRYYFQENQILILRKPKHTDKKYKSPYQSTCAA
jgi:hypothetical protein